MSADLVITVVILAGAGAWAGRRLWRWLRPGAPAASACGGGGCGSCPVGQSQPQSLEGGLPDTSRKA